MNLDLTCRICGQPSASGAGSYSPFRDFTVELFDCSECLCRFVRRDPDIYERLHRLTNHYSSHSTNLDCLSRLCAEGDVGQIRDVLSRTPKQSFVIERMDRRLPSPGRVLEVGCSSGQLASYAIAIGHDFVGCDVSASAIEEAQRAFAGSNFEVVSDGSVPDGLFDFIYHVGTIGCVEDPIELTEKLLDKLSVRGRLVFNAPNRDTVDRFGVPWVRGTTPPDLVTLFDMSFWHRFDGPEFSVSVTVREAPVHSAPTYLLQRVVGEPRRGNLFAPVKDDPRPLSTSDEKAVRNSRQKSILGMIGKLTRIRPAADDFGILVEIERR